MHFCLISHRYIADWSAVFSTFRHPCQSAAPLKVFSKFFEFLKSAIPSNSAYCSCCSWVFTREASCLAIGSWALPSCESYTKGHSLEKRSKKDFISNARLQSLLRPFPSFYLLFAQNLQITRVFCYEWYTEISQK